MTETNPVSVRDEFLRVCKEKEFRIRIHLPYGMTITGYVMGYDKTNLAIVSKPSKDESCMAPIQNHLLERSACLWIEQLTT